MIAQQFGPFTGGIDNRSNEKALAGNFLRTADNVDIDDRGILYDREGCGAATISGAAHSGWNNKAQTMALYVKGAVLYCRNTAGTSAAIRSDLIPGLRMQYVEVNDSVYYTNNQVIGYIRDFKDYALDTPTKNFKRILPPGELIEFYNGRLYTIKGGLARWSDSMEFNSCDYRRNFKMVPGRFTLFKAVQGGIYISFNGCTYFASGPHLGESSLVLLEEHEAVPNSAINVSRVMADDGSGSDIRWVSANGGVCRGLDNGVFQNLSSKKHVIPSGVFDGAPLYRVHSSGFGQYLCNLTIKA